jgi:hypothetical protein
VHPSGHSIAKEQRKADAVIAGCVQRVATQLLVMDGEILVGNGGRRGFLHGSFF